MPRTPPKPCAGSARAAPSRCSTTIPIGSPRSSATSAILKRHWNPDLRMRRRRSSSSTRTRPMSAILRRACSRSGWRRACRSSPVFHMGGGGRVLALPSARARSLRASRSSKARRWCSARAGWQSICDPMLKAAGVDITKIKYVDAGWPTWGTALMSRARAMPRCRGKAFAPSGRARASTSTIGWAATSRSFPPTASSSARPISTMPRRRTCTSATSAAGRWDSSSAGTTRALRPRSSWSSSRALPRR